MTIDERVKKITEILDDKKANTIEVLDLSGADYISDRVVIANSLNGKHTIALFEYLKKGLTSKGEEFLASDTTDEWSVVDLGDILIHIMIPSYREKYSLEVFLKELMD
jgi:ribosome silencing factor RsfS/YbeB/iojap